MKKRIISILALSLVLLIISSGSILAADNNVTKDQLLKAPEQQEAQKEITSSVGLAKPAFGSFKYNKEGKVKAIKGINWGLGYTYRNYFTPGLEEGFNGYWEAGTVAIIAPYAEVGTDFVFAMEDDGSHWSVSAGIMAMTNFNDKYVLPSLGVARRF